MDFHCGHIVAEANGGETNLSNLKPICKNCNLSMGTINMNKFMEQFN
jgi:5-methylcytosine-specific restriction endonuclease McrA